MRRRLAAPALSLLASASMLCCGSSRSTGPAEAGASPGSEQPLCAPCDPSLPTPCDVGKDVCRNYYCDAVEKRCLVRLETLDAFSCGGDVLPVCGG